MYKDVYQRIRRNYLVTALSSLALGIVGVFIMAQMSRDIQPNMLVFNQIKTVIFLMMMILIPTDHILYNKKIQSFSSKNVKDNLMKIKSHYSGRMLSLLILSIIQITFMVIFRDKSMFYTFLIVIFYMLVIYPTKSRLAKEILLKEEDFSLLDK